MTLHREFDLIVPRSLEEALSVLAEHGTDNADATLPLAGGTNLLVDIRDGRTAPVRLVSLARLKDMRWVEVKARRAAIGGRATLGDILHHPGMAEAAPSLVASAKVFGGQMVRNAATVAGNVAYGSPAADVMPPLLSLDAEIELTGPSGARRVPLARYFAGFKQPVRRADELITAIEWRRPAPGEANLFYKLGRRKGDAITVVDIAVTLGADNGRCAGVRIALGAVAPVVLRAGGAEAMLEGEAPTPELIDAAARKAAAECDPIDDLRASAEYRRHCTHMLVRRLLGQAWSQVG
ncbi:MAG: xanthine dehydrogenase family protein subunit M [Gammaproteobacteria bacterium]|nr:xanthine dehydrogenase family protein subunit M [Gammaproteobacteria bacterium]NIR85596.1 xanthine dehydrogenase family protein subunit M [Gammaproteobacteria bacterium]NIR90037.1 xanthine dehydrogenase family protein subunit M [Gammaproteobacteria bacterium]NIU06725.1 xanthine dehydrogenase family protein subunit M [Gammaproteobacteria bacterium]NIV53656.1 xanthine dehydrogenase family protein subunit M [Gammaproteobacteria bacterium]